MMREKHPDAELVAVDSHFINPFSSVRRSFGDSDTRGLIQRVEIVRRGGAMILACAVILLVIGTVLFHFLAPGGLHRSRPIGRR